MKGIFIRVINKLSMQIVSQICSC